MKTPSAIILLTLAAALPAQADQQKSPSDDGFAAIFDGESLKNWSGDPKFWKIEDGALTGQTTAENQTKDNTSMIWEAGELDDFELKLQFRIDNGNSSIQIRSFRLPEAVDTWRVGGYQAELNKAIKKGDWNEFHIIAKGDTIKQSINGVPMAELTDNGPDKRRTGLFALQLHAGSPMKVQFKDIRLKRTKLDDAKKICFFAGRRSHGYGTHEHHAGNTLLGKRLRAHYGEQVIIVYYKDGWPNDPTAMQNADAIIMFCDGGGAHFVKMHQRQVNYFQDRGMGIGCIHYGVEVQKGKAGGDSFLDWIGGYFEAGWSVNPHWNAEFTEFPDHPVAAGLKPFNILDEWYYHMRFRPEMKGITPILTALPGADSLPTQRQSGCQSRSDRTQRKAARHVGRRGRG